MTNRKKALEDAIGAMRIEVAALINAKTTEWGTAEGMLSRELTEQAGRDVRMSQLVYDISKSAGSSVQHTALHQLVEAIVQRPIPKTGYFASMPVGAAVLSGGFMYVVTKSDSAAGPSYTIGMNGQSSTLAGSDKTKVTLPTEEEVNAQIAVAPAPTVLSLYEAFNAAAAATTVK